MPVSDPSPEQYAAVVKRVGELDSLVARLETEVRWLRGIIEHYGGEEAKAQLRSMDDPGGGS